MSNKRYQTDKEMKDALESWNRMLGAVPNNPHPNDRFSDAIRFLENRHRDFIKEYADKLVRLEDEMNVRQERLLEQVSRIGDIIALVGKQVDSLQSQIDEIKE